MKSASLARSAAHLSLFVLLAAVSSCVVIDIFDDDNEVNDTRFEATASFRHVIAAENRFRLRLDGISGDIDVAADPAATDVTIEGDRTVGSESVADAERHLDNLDVRVETSATEVHVSTIQPEHTLGRSYTVEYRITVPSSFRSTITNVNGSVVVRGTSGRVEVTHVNGDVTLRDVEADVDVNLVNGLIDAEVDPPLAGRVELTNVNGNVLLSVPAAISADVTASVTNGSISVSNLSILDPISTSRTLRGTLGAGDGVIELVTVNGNITLRGR